MSAPPWVACPLLFPPVLHCLRLFLPPPALRSVLRARQPDRLGKPVLLRKGEWRRLRRLRLPHNNRVLLSHCSWLLCYKEEMYGLCSMKNCAPLFIKFFMWWATTATLTTSTSYGPKQIFLCLRAKRSLNEAGKWFPKFTDFWKLVLPFRSLLTAVEIVCCSFWSHLSYTGVFASCDQDTVVRANIVADEEPKASYPWFT